MRAAVFMITSLVIFTGFVFLQVYLSKKESKWAGRVLPVITFGISLIPLFSIETSGYYPQDALTMTIALLLFNIPTAVLVTIFASFRGKHRQQRALEKMSAQDLE